MFTVIVKVAVHIRRIEEVEKNLKALRESSASKEDTSKVRAEMKKLYDGLHVGTLAVVDLSNDSLKLVSRILGSACACVGHA